jgi:hypothetical protein
MSDPRDSLSDRHLSMGQEQWSAVDEYVGGLLAPHDEALEAALSASEKAGLPQIQVSPPQGKLLNLDAGRLQHDLAGEGAARRRTPGHA